MEDEDSTLDQTNGLEPLLGELTTMCSVDEAKLRTETRQVDRFELAASAGREISIDLAKAVKKYQRSSADKKYYANETRTVAACWETVEYLITTLLDFDTNPKPNFSEICYSSTFFEIYSFLRDRLRAVRVDLHVQNALDDPVFILVHEICLRFELLSLFLLWGRDFGGSDDRKFDVHLSLTALSQTIDPLSNAYAKRRSVRKLSQSELNIEAEITSYVLLLALTSRGGSKTFKSHYLKQPLEIQTHPTVVEAYNTVCEYYSGNFAHFLSRYTESQFLSACCMLPVVNIARTKQLWRTVRTNRPFFIRKDPSTGPMPPPRPEKLFLNTLFTSLGFSSVNECTDFVRFCGLETDMDVCLIPPRQLTKNPITWWTSSEDWRAQANDHRDFTNYEWPTDLLDSFHKRIGEDVGDDCPPERSEYPMKVELGLEMKYKNAGTRKNIVMAAMENSVANTPLVSRVTVPMPLSNLFTTPTFFPMETTFVAPVKVERPVVPLEPLEVVKRPRDSPEKPTIPVIIEKPPLKKLHEEPIQPVAVVHVPHVVVVPMPTLPAMDSSFDLLAAELGRVTITGPPAPQIVERLVTDEREIEIAKRRLKYVALKCLRSWRDANGEAHRWKWLLGSVGRAPARINP